jgi:hypothetical protein
LKTKTKAVRLRPKTVRAIRRAVEAIQTFEAADIPQQRKSREAAKAREVLQVSLWRLFNTQGADRAFARRCLNDLAADIETRTPANTLGEEK